jgi:hypothetical protein
VTKAKQKTNEIKDFSSIKQDLTDIQGFHFCHNDESYFRLSSPFGFGWHCHVVVLQPKSKQFFVDTKPPSAETTTITQA